MNLSLSFIRGLLASINPCGFVLLPTYLMYFLGVSTVDGHSQRAPIGRALMVGTSVSAGFLGVFFTIGAGDVDPRAERERAVRARRRVGVVPFAATRRGADPCVSLRYLRYGL